VNEESDLVTGEAVVLDLPVARLATRGLAMMLDVLLQVALLFILFVVLAFTTSSNDGSLVLTILLISFVLVMVGYPVLMETLTRGRTLGKLALGLRVVRADGGPIRFRQALARGLGGFFVDFWALGFLGAVAVVVSMISRDGKRVGDYLAGTVVIRERVGVSESVMIPMPPPLAQWASQLDLTRLPDGLALAARDYLSRMHQLRPDAAQSLGYGLAQQVGQAIGAPLPPGVPVWAYLAAVLAERRARDQARVFGPPPTSYAPPQPYLQAPPPQPAPAPSAQPAPPADSPFTPPS
jgi:uncharacterized RDD family membrane protein YckC